MKNKISKETMASVADFSSPGSPLAKFISFKVRVAEIFKMKFDGGTSSAFELGMRRAEFEEKQYRLLVDLTDQATSAFVKSRRKTWQRRIEKRQVAQERFKFLMQKRATERKDYIDGPEIQSLSANQKSVKPARLRLDEILPQKLTPRRKSETVLTSPRRFALPLAL